MNTFLRLKHWQLFLLGFILPVICQPFALAALTKFHNAALGMGLFLLMMLLCLIPLFSWFYALGTNLYPKLPEMANMKLKKFKIFWLIPVLYIGTIMIFIGTKFVLGIEALNIPGAVVLIVVLLHLFSMFCIFYCLYFVAKSLKAVELERPVSFSDYAGEFFLIWFFPIGVWFIQPRINSIFSDRAPEAY
ncbi:MAG: hypothetical protein JST70_11630 [Bacteroidetes bacterium]|nr:hypothetical protein [Bacteroidota bacterium]